MVGICGAEFSGFFDGTIVPLTAYAAIITSILIAISFMVGRALANAKLTLWAKTEAIQIAVSIVSIFFLVAIVDTFCIIDMGEIANVFNITAPTDPMDVYTAAETYLKEAAIYSHNAMTVTRYHLEAYTIFAYMNAFKCDYETGGIGWGCFFGYSGSNQQPLGGYGVQIAALNIFFNSTIISHFTALNFLFILLFVYRGFVFVFLPLGVFLRSMPYLRSFGSLLISLALSFLVVYPFLLSVFYLMGDVLVDRPSYTPTVAGTALDNYYDEKVFPNEEDAAAGASTAAAFLGEDYIHDQYFPHGENVVGAITFAAYAFVAALFMPTIALLGTIASVSYLARLYGEEIDLSRITRLV
jgi:hypothetical protein